MSRYIRKAHGLSYGNNIYACRAENGEMVTFTYVLTIDAYQGADSMLNFEIRTPAEQLLFAKRTIYLPVSGKAALLQSEIDIFELKPFFRKWLDENTAGWGIRAQLTDMIEVPELYFHRRKDVLAFINLIDEQISCLTLP
jgi:hypothetical protein